jgi:hypothetical protein
MGHGVDALPHVCTKFGVPVLIEVLAIDRISLAFIELRNLGVSEELGFVNIDAARWRSLWVRAALARMS